MNAERLIAHYERIAEAPDAIGRLRRFILDLAVRGKLVPQGPQDEPASELLKRIAQEKARLVKAGEIRKFDVPEMIAVDDQPFAIPKSWQWVRLGDILTKLTDGTHHSPPNEPAGDFKYVTAKNIKNAGVLLDDVTYVDRKVHDEIFARCNPAKGDILYIKDGATTGIVTINDLDEPFSMLSSVALLKLPSCLFNRLVAEFLRSPFFYDQMRGFMKGAAITRVTLKRMAPALIPLPPLAEQHRIVAKVDELMGLCDQLEAARAEREATRDRLTASSLARLNAPDPETFQDDARFVLNALPALTTRPDQIKQLRQTILNLAVRGKLVPQDPTDEPASELLKRIAEEREVKDKGAKLRTKRPIANSDSETANDLPEGWAVQEIGNLVDPTATISYGVLVPGPDVDDGVPFVRAQDLSLSGHAPRPNKTIAPEIEAPYVRTRLKGGEILLCVVGSIGKLGIAPASWAGANIARAVARIAPVEAICSNYLLLAMRSDLIQNYFTQATRTLAQPTLNVGLIEVLPVPVPPLAEQRRIVAKVDELMALCGQLEASLTDTAATSRRLIDALLAEALAPADVGQVGAVA